MKIISFITILVPIGLIIGACGFYVLLHFAYDWFYENIFKPASRKKSFRIFIYILWTCICCGMIILLIYILYLVAGWGVLGILVLLILFPLFIVFMGLIVVYWFKGLFSLRREFHEIASGYEIARRKKDDAIKYGPRNKSLDKKVKVTNTVQCPLCGERVLKSAKYCNHCGGSLS